MTLLEEQIENNGLKQIWIAKELNITTRTLQHWIKYNNLNQVTTFIKLLELLNINFVDLVEDMQKNEAL